MSRALVEERIEDEDLFELSNIETHSTAEATSPYLNSQRPDNTTRVQSAISLQPQILSQLNLQDFIVYLPHSEIAYSCERHFAMEVLRNLHYDEYAFLVPLEGPRPVVYMSLEDLRAHIGCTERPLIFAHKKGLNDSISRSAADDIHRLAQEFDRTEILLTFRYGEEETI